MVGILAVETEVIAMIVNTANISSCSSDSRSDNTVSSNSTSIGTVVHFVATVINLLAAAVTVRRNI